MKIVKRILTVILVMVFAVFLCYFIFHLDTVKVEGTEYYTDEEIIQSVFTRDYSDNEIMFFLYDQIYGINTLPFVEEIEAEYHSPSSMTLHVYDKTISGCIHYMGQYVYFDKDGIVLQTLPEKLEGVPVVTGINFGNFTVGKPFGVKDDSVFEPIMNVSQQIGHYSLPIDKIKVNNGDIRLVSGHLKVELGKKERYDDEMAELAGVLEQAEESKLKLKGTIHMENYQPGDKIIVEPPDKSPEAPETSASPEPPEASGEPEDGTETAPETTPEPGW